MDTPPKKKRPRLVDLTQLGQRVREARQERGLSQLDLAGLLGSAQGWLSELEKGKHASMEVDTVRRLAETLSVSTDYLLGLTDDQAPRAATPRRRRKAATNSTQALAMLEQHYSTPDDRPPGYWDDF